MKFLIIGGNGLVGKSLIQELKNSSHTFIASYNSNPVGGKLKCDILNKEDLENAFEVAKPDIVINATNLAGGVDFCENNPELAENFHFVANVNIGELCKKYHAKMVLISTDYVFDGSTPPYSESDKVNPLNKYGQYKLLAEKWIQKNFDNYIIVRTTNVFGWDPFTKTPNFLMGLFSKLKLGERVNVPSFLWGNPTHVSQLSRTILELCVLELNGTFHVVGSSFINRYEWASLFCNLLKLDRRLLVEIKEPPDKMIPRPLRSYLSTAKVSFFCKTPVEDVKLGLLHFRDEMQHNLVSST